MEAKQILTTSFDKEKYDKLEKQYNEAVEKKETQFTFEDKPVLVAYAKYLLEYLKPIVR
jgi:DNA/RNA-binding domain of Phe-tRNA-synthetase-like protein